MRQHAKPISRDGFIAALVERPKICVDKACGRLRDLQGAALNGQVDKHRRRGAVAEGQGYLLFRALHGLCVAVAKVPGACAAGIVAL